MRDRALACSVSLDADELALVGSARIIRDDGAANDAECTAVLTLSCLLLLLAQLLLGHSRRVGLERTHCRALVHLLLLLLFVAVRATGRLLHWLVHAVVAHAGAELVGLLLTVGSFALGVGLLLVDYFDGLIIIIILAWRYHLLPCRAQGGRLVHHADLLLNFCTVLCILVFKSCLILHVSLLVLRVGERLLHLLLLLAALASRMCPLAFVSRLRHGDFLAILEGLQVSLLLAGRVHVELFVFVEQVIHFLVGDRLQSSRLLIGNLVGV